MAGRSSRGRDFLGNSQKDKWERFYSRKHQFRAASGPFSCNVELPVFLPGGNFSGHPRPPCERKKVYSILTFGDIFSTNRTGKSAKKKVDDHSEY